MRSYLLGLRVEIDCLSYLLLLMRLLLLLIMHNLLLLLLLSLNINRMGFKLLWSLHYELLRLRSLKYDLLIHLL